MKSAQISNRNRPQSIQSLQSGFTLIELMIVVAIIGILAAVAIPAYQDYVTKAKIAKVASATSAVQTAVAQYSQENGGAIALATADAWTALGLSGAPNATTEVASISVSTAGVITANVVAGAAGAAGCAITWTPPTGTATTTAFRWTVAATTCPTTVQNIVAKWN